MGNKYDKTYVKESKKTHVTKVVGQQRTAKEREREKKMTKKAQLS